MLYSVAVKCWRLQQFHLCLRLMKTELELQSQVPLVPVWATSCFQSSGKQTPVTFRPLSQPLGLESVIAQDLEKPVQMANDLESVFFFYTLQLYICESLCEHEFIHPGTYQGHI